MKKFVAPEVEIIKFAIEDVITASGDPDIPLMVGDCVS